MKRAFFIVHSLGVTHAEAETAGEALARAWLPLGFRDACAVIDTELVTQGERTAGPFRAIIGQPAAAEGRPA